MDAPFMMYQHKRKALIIKYEVTSRFFTDAFHQTESSFYLL